MSLTQNQNYYIESIPQLLLLGGGTTSPNNSQKMVFLLISGTWLTAVLLIVFIKNRKWLLMAYFQVLYSLILAAQIYNANIRKQNIWYNSQRSQVIR